MQIERDRPSLSATGEAWLDQTLFEREESYESHSRNTALFISQPIGCLAWPNFVRKRRILCKLLSKINRGIFPFVQKWRVSKGLNENHPEMPGANFFPKKCCVECH
jgi:hypothetical protein